MKVNNQNTAAVILAAGQGTRLNCEDIPKVMLELGNKPMIEHTIETLEELGFDSDHINLVVGFKKEKVIDYFNGRTSFVEQKEQKGTAHAAYLGMKELSDDINHVLVLGGDDSAFYEPSSLEKFLKKHTKQNLKLSLLSTKVEQPDQYGRIVRKDNGEVEIIEKEYLTEKQKEVNEVSTGTFCFDRNWYEGIFPDMPIMRKLGEYGLPTALAMAREQNKDYQIVELKDSDEWIGVNTPKDLRQARAMMEAKSNSVDFSPAY